MDLNDVETTGINNDESDTESKILSCIRPLLNTNVHSLTMNERKTLFAFSNPIDPVSAKRLKALGFSIGVSEACFDGKLKQGMEILTQRLSSSFNGRHVTNVIIDDEFANVTATVDGVSNVDCGFLEDYAY